MIPFDRWTIQQVDATDVPRLARLWAQLQQFPTLFSDSTKGDLRNWLELLADPSTVWFEVMDGIKTVGLIYFILDDDDAKIHIVFFDRAPAEKRELVKKICELVFDGCPQIHRISAEIPEIYHGTCRLADKVGFRWEGKKREAVMIGGRRQNVQLYSLLRTDGLPQESRQDRGDDLRNDLRGSSGREGAWSGPRRGVGS